MSALSDTLSLPWPWYVGGPLIGLLAASLLLLTGEAAAPARMLTA